MLSCVKLVVESELSESNAGFSILFLLGKHVFVRLFCFDSFNTHMLLQLSINHVNIPLIITRLSLFWCAFSWAFAVVEKKQANLNCPHLSLRSWSGGSVTWVRVTVKIVAQLDWRLLARAFQGQTSADGGEQLKIRIQGGALWHGPIARRLLLLLLRHGA